MKILFSKYFLKIEKGFLKTFKRNTTQKDRFDAYTLGNNANFPTPNKESQEKEMQAAQALFTPADTPQRLSNIESKIKNIDKQIISILNKLEDIRPVVPDIPAHVKDAYKAYKIQ